MALYNIKVIGNILEIGFGDLAKNNEIVSYVAAQLKGMTAAGKIAGGKILKINGPASLPVAMTIAHAVGHMYETIGVFDPKLCKYVVVISHGGAQVGELID